MEKTNRFIRARTRVCPNCNEEIVTFPITHDEASESAAELHEAIEWWTRNAPRSLIVIDIRFGEPPWLAELLQKFRGFGIPTILHPSERASASATKAMGDAEISCVRARAKCAGLVSFKKESKVVREKLNAGEIRSIVKAQIDRIREVHEDNADIRVPLQLPHYASARVVRTNL